MELAAQASWEAWGEEETVRPQAPVQPLVLRSLVPRRKWLVLVQWLGFSLAWRGLHGGGEGIDRTRAPCGQHLWGRRVLGSVGAQAPSAVILEPQKIKSDTVSTVSPSISHEVMGPEAMIFVFWMYLKQTNKSSIQIFSRKKMIFSSNMLSRLCSWAGRIWREFYFCISYFCIKSSQTLFFGVIERH